MSLPSDVDLLRAVAMRGAALNFARDGVIRPVVFLLDEAGHVDIVATVGQHALIAEMVREIARKQAIAAVAVIGEAWTATVRTEEDLHIRARDRADRREIVRLEILTRRQDYAWEAPIGGDPRTLGPFKVSGLSLVGPYARLLQQTKEN